MYVPKLFEETDLGVLHSLIAMHPLGTWVSGGQHGLDANHLPFLLDASRGEHGTLMAHVARPNPAWQSSGAQIESIVIFQGSNVYLTPSWYASKQTDGQVVPTWNYAVVHAYGTPRVIEDRDWLLDHVMRQTDRHEAGRPQPWKVSDAPRDYIDRLLSEIVGIEIPIARLTGKWKVSQNRPTQDRLGVVKGLLAQDDAASRCMASLVRERSKKRSSHR